MTMDSQKWLERKDNRNNPDRFGEPSPRERSREAALRAWLGPERTPGVFAQLRAESHSFGEIVDELLETLPGAEIRLRQRLEADWARILPEKLARECHPFRVEGNTLFVEIFHSPWLYVFKNQHARKIEELVSQATQGQITRIVFQAAGYRRRQ